MAEPRDEAELLRRVRKRLTKGGGVHVNSGWSHMCGTQPAPRHRYRWDLGYSAVFRVPCLLVDAQTSGAAGACAVS